MCIKFCLRRKFFLRFVLSLLGFGSLLLLQGNLPENVDGTEVRAASSDMETLYRNSRFPRNTGYQMLVHKYMNNEWILDGNTCINNDWFLTGALLDGPQGTLPIYIHFPKEDQHVSGGIFREGGWESRLVRFLHEVLYNDTSLDFIDIGANIGVYTLTMAKLGRQVIAVEPFKPNIKRLCRTLEDNRVSHRVTLITNPLSNNRTLVAMQTHYGNIGATNVRERQSNDTDILQTVTLDDVYRLKPLHRAVIKMDVESHESKVLQGGIEFFDKVDVPLILMEWMLHANNKDASGIIKFMTERRMFPYTTDPTPIPLQLHLFAGWPTDIFWIKRGAFALLEPKISVLQPFSWNF